MTDNSDSTSKQESDSLLDEQIKVSPYRWVVLLAFSFVSLIIQVLWITFAPITDESASFFNVNTNAILILSMVFMLIYVPMNFPATISIDKFGLRWGTGIGVILTGVFGFLRAFFIPNYTWLFICQLGIAIGQPFVLNSFTKLATNWFPEKEKTLASGISTMAMLLGAIVAFVVTPIIYSVSNISTVLLVYGITSLLFMVLYIVLIKDKPAHPPNVYSIKAEEELEKVKTRLFFKNRDFVLLFILVFIGLGAFNAISTEIDILFNDPNNVSASGNIGGCMIFGGISGAVILSTLSDKFKKRKIFLIIAMAGGAIFTFLLWLIPSYIGQLILAFFFGFTLVSALPIGLTFAAEITYPAPEEASNGLIMWIGQISGILLIVCVMIIPSLTANFMIITALFVIGTVIAFFLNDLDTYQRTEE
ncbi:MAG: MFS transporter [Candidatus Heimdallarchaeaceae archaeon]